MPDALVRRWAVATVALGVVSGTVRLGAQPAGASRAAECPSCAEWNAPHAPLKLFGNTYYVGTDGLTALLVTSRAGHVLIDGGLPESAPRILANIEALGFRPRDVRWLLNSHEHFDHAGGLGLLQQATGAEIAASPPAAWVIERGTSGPSDPQLGLGLDFPKAVGPVRRIADGDTIRVGPLAIVARFTPGHTPGGTTWTWRDCEGSRCLDFVYADSQTPIASDDFRFTSNTRYPSVISDFERSHRVLEGLRCDVLVTPHPGASGLWDRVHGMGARGVEALVDPGACRAYAARARAALAARLAKEGAAP